MPRINVVALLSGLLSLALLNNFTQAQPLPTFTDYTWVGGTGVQQWQLDANWDLTGFPNDTDPEPEDLVYPVAVMEVPLASDLTVNVGTSPVTIAGLKLGGLSGIVNSEVTSGVGGQLIFRNDFISDFVTPDNDADFDNSGAVLGSDFLIWQINRGSTNPDAAPNGDETNWNDSGDADADNDVDADDLAIWTDQYGFGADPLSSNNAFIVSGGVAGSVNRISSPILLEDEPVGVSAPNPLTLTSTATITNSAADMESNARFDVFDGTVTVNSQVVVTNVATGEVEGDDVDIQLRATGDNSLLILNGVVRHAVPADEGNVTFGGGTGRVEIYGDNEITGTTRTFGEILLGHDHALGVNPTDNEDSATVRGSNIFISNDDARNIPNDFVLQSTLVARGDKSLTLSGTITQTNNRGFNNELEGPAMLILDGTLQIWEDDESGVPREFDFSGPGTTKITGIIRDGPGESLTNRGLNISGPGVVIIDVSETDGDADNVHTGPTFVAGGNLHYATNAALNAGPGRIRSHGGAVGVDTGIAGNTTFNSKIDSNSYGGIMLAASDANATIDFVNDLPNAARMTVAAPETGMSFTGTINPANQTYGLGGGEGTLTLPNAQLPDVNAQPTAVEVRNGGTVELLGENSYTGPTSIFGRPTTTLVVDDLADGGANSGIGAASSAAENLYIQGGVLKYIGDGDTTDRLFTIGASGATLDSSGDGAVVFSNSGTLGRHDPADRDGDLNAAGNNPSGQGYGPGTVSDIQNPAGVTIVKQTTRDLAEGMPISDPGTEFTGTFSPPAPCESNGSTCIPDDATIDGFGVDYDLTQTIELSEGVASNLAKLGAQLTFGVVERTLTLAGTNADDNTLASVISDSAAGSIVSIEKVGTGTWVLSGSNTYTGDTIVEEGTLSITSDFLADASGVELGELATLELDFSGADVIETLMVDGMELADGIYGATDGGAGYNVLSQLSGSGFLNVGNVPFPLGAIAAVPEPSAAILAMIACFGMSGVRRTNRR